jgi:hypothetical protein
MQRKEGDWPNYGSARPPLEDGGFSHTAKGIRALSLYAIPGRKSEFDDRTARAAAWLSVVPTDSFAGSRILGLRISPNWEKCPIGAADASGYARDGGARVRFGALSPQGGPAFRPIGPGF